MILFLFAGLRSAICKEIMMKEPCKPAKMFAILEITKVNKIQRLAQDGFEPALILVVTVDHMW